MTEQRVHSRKSLRMEAQMADESGQTWSTIDLLNISLGGIAFIAQEHLPQGCERLVKFHLPGNDKELGLTTTVVCCFAHPFLRGYRTGGAFVSMDPEVHDAIESYIENVSD